MPQELKPDNEIAPEAKRNQMLADSAPEPELQKAAQRQPQETPYQNRERFGTHGC